VRSAGTTPRDRSATHTRRRASRAVRRTTDPRARHEAREPTPRRALVGKALCAAHTAAKASTTSAPNGP
jgi:hypothetical protein